jgi:hypothetical protein
LGISWSQLLERNHQTIVDHRQLELDPVTMSGAVHVLPNAMVGLGGHALVEMAGGQGHHQRTHPGQVIDAHLARANEGTGSGPNLAALDQALDDLQLAVRCAFLRRRTLTDLVFSNRVLVCQRRPQGHLFRRLQTHTLACV